ncbi:MAG TPA: transposase [Candidatus Binataceae bacterium]|nr:transposase [Candidatus Binataceae bacterium]
MRRRRARGELALVDLDGHVKPLYGEHKEGADFSYDGRWSYQPLVVSLAGSGECLRVVNQPGSARSSEAAAGALRAVLPRVKRHFQNALVRGDTDFDRADVLQEVIEQEAYFAIGGRVYANRAALAQALPESAWQPFIPRAQRGRGNAPARRWRTANWRKHQAAQRGFRNLRTIGQWITELSYQPTGVSGPCRMIVRRIRIEEQDRQGALFESFRYRLILTNLPRSYTPREIVDLAYQRCDQENVIEQFGCRDCGLAHAGGGVYGQLGVASDRPPGLESGQMDRATGIARGSGALGVEALPAPFRLHCRQGAKQGSPSGRAAHRLPSLSAPAARGTRPAAGLNPVAHSFPARSMTTAMRWQ